MPQSCVTNNEALDAGQLIDRMWRDWIALRERFDKHDTTPADPLTRMRLQYELHARGLMIGSLPAPDHHALSRKVLLAAWFRQYGGTWATIMMDVAIMADMDALQTTNDQPA